VTAAPGVTRMPQERRAEARIVGVDQLLFHPRNVRTDLGDLRELADSIAIEGVLVPVMAERRGQTLRLLHGHRRVAAARLAGLRRVPCIVVAEHDDDEVISVMLAENLQRAGLSREEKRTAVRTLRDEFGHTVEGIAARLGVCESTVRAWVRDPDWRDRKGTTPGVKAAQRARVYPGRVHELCQRWEGRAPAELLAELRDLIGGWEPAARNGPHRGAELRDDQRHDGSTSVSAGLLERVAREDHAATTAAQLAHRLGVSGRQVTRARRAIREHQH